MIAQSVVFISHRAQSETEKQDGVVLEVLGEDNRWQDAQ